ncbi:MAG: UvrB/UvrC motif-containing protein [Victivallaceae bacterium]|nr:UvrB/UvrC motif-containing protein [Victivallaceae bacterium]
MLCDICGKNEATIHIEEITDGASKTVHLCGECMAKNPQFGGLGVSPFNLAEIVLNLGGKLAAKMSSQKPDEKPETMIKCPVCGWTSRELGTTGLLGCPSCYAVFEPVLEPAISSMHRGGEHSGKRAVKPEVSTEDEYRLQKAALRKELADCIKKEDYEQAAVLRDRLAALVPPFKSGNENK